METLQPTPPPRRRFGLLLGIGIGLVVVALIGLGVVFIPRLLGTTAPTLNVTAAAMPAGTQFYFSFNPHFEQLPNGGVVLKAWSDPEIAESIEGSIRDALEDNDVDWDQDIAPWLGDEIGLGIGNLPLDPNASSETPPSLVLVAVTRDVVLSNAFLAKWRANRESGGSEFTEQTYRDVPTVEQTDTGFDQPMAYATVKDQVIVATGSNDLHAVIDAALDGTGLDTSSNYQATLSQLRGGRAVTAYMDAGPLFETLIEQMQASGGVPPAAVNQSALDALDALQGVAMGLSFEANGLLLETVASADVSRLPGEQQAALTARGSSNRLLRAVPDSTFLYLGSEILPDTLDALADDPNFAASLEMIESQTGIDLTTDVFSWLTGEFAIVAMPGSLISSGPSQLPFGFALILEATDQQAAEAGAHKLIQTLVDQSGGEIGEVEVSGNRLRAVLDTVSGDPVLVYGSIGDRLVLALPQNAAQKIADTADDPLADDETFKTAIAPLPTSNSGYFYLKPKPIVDLLSLGLTFSGQECLACALFEPVRALAFAAEQPQIEAGLGRTTLFVLLDTSGGE